MQTKTNLPPAGMIDNPAYAEWLFAHFDDNGAQGPEPAKFIPDPAAKKAVIKTPPATTVAKCAQYRSRSYTCSCPDKQRGGSYADDRTHEMICKHQAALRNGSLDVVDVKCLEQGITRDEYFARIERGIAKAWPSKAQPEAPAKPVIDWFAYLEIA